FAAGLDLADAGGGAVLHGTGIEEPAPGGGQHAVGEIAVGLVHRETRAHESVETGGDLGEEGIAGGVENHALGGASGEGAAGGPGGLLGGAWAAGERASSASGRSRGGRVSAR